MLGKHHQAQLLELLSAIAVPVAIIEVVETDGFKVFVANHLASRFFGLEPSDIEGRRLDAILASGQAAQVLRRLKRYLRSGAHAICEAPIETPTGQECLCTIAPVTDHAGTIWIVVTLTDVLAAKGGSRIDRATLGLASPSAARPPGRMTLHYQPQIDLRTGQVTGVEALLRWLDPHRGLVLPSAFVAVAEDSGLIQLLDQWALAAACRQLRRWHDAGLSPIRIAVNLSPLHFANASVVGMIRSILAAHRLDPEHLGVEITEGSLLRTTDAVRATLCELSEFGVELVIDDFGTGYTSLRHLRELPFHKIKIDRSITAGLITSARDLAITRAIITLGHSLDLRVLAEGVETKAQLVQLRQLECDEAQGYLLSKPMPANACAHHLAASLDHARRDHGSCA